MQEEITRRKNFMVNAGYTVFIIIITVFVFLTAGLIMPFWIALLLAAILQPLIRLLDRKLKTKKKTLSNVVLLLFYLIIGGVLIWVISGLAYFLEEAFLYFPDYYEMTIRPVLTSLGDTMEKLLAIFPAQIRPDFEVMQANVLDTIQSSVTSISQQGISLVSNFFSGLTSSFLAVLMTILLSYFINSQYEVVVAFLKHQLPEKVRGSISEIKLLLKNSVLKYIRACMIMMVITFVELSIGFLIIGVSNPFGMAIGIAFFDALPVFGTGTIMIPWAFFELLNGNFSFAGGLILLYVLIALIRNLLEPKIIGTQLGLNPIVALVSIYLGYKLLGIIGMISFPIIAYVLLALHEAGKIKLYNVPPQ